MDWFDRPPAKGEVAQNAAAQSFLQDLDRRFVRYLDDVDQARLVYPACKRARSDANGDLRSLWDHTRLEAVRYVMMVPRQEYRLLAEPASQLEIIDAYLRQRPHDDIVIDFTGSTTSDLAIAITAGFNWLNHCAGLVEVDRSKFRATLTHFRKITVLAHQWWSTPGADVRYAEMLSVNQTPPLFINLIWLEYTRLAKEIASAAMFGPSIERAIEQRRNALSLDFADKPAELVAALDELGETMKRFEDVRDPDGLKCWDFVTPAGAFVAVEGCHDASGGTAGGQIPRIQLGHKQSDVCPLPLPASRRRAKRCQGALWAVCRMNTNSLLWKRS